ncbi:MAG: hypothetical protein KBT27_05545, partial [Prevotellaceae bacterium]|nr:hypothetical protein [Candidatus Faecinaster equi]
MKKSIVCLTTLLCSLCVLAQVNYSKIPDYNNRPPVDPTLGIPNYGQSKFKSNSYAKSAENGLPDHWNNAITKYYPPTFNQAGPSCMCSSFVGYIFTHELNAYRRLDGANPDNQMAIFFSWQLTFQNSDKEHVQLNNGCPSATVYGGRTYSSLFGYYDWHNCESGWMQGYDKWYSAMFNRASGHYSFPETVKTQKGREDLKRWIYNHNGDESFDAGGVCYVILAATGMTTSTIPSTPANDEAGLTGKYYLVSWGPEMDHALTIVGYDDRVEFDLDGNGVVGEENKDEKGCWIVCNSWGSTWLNNSYIYVPYKNAGVLRKGEEPWDPYVTYIRKDYAPKRTLKVKMDYSNRSDLLLSGGASQDTAAKKASKTMEFDHFKHAGDSREDKTEKIHMPMLGKWADGKYHTEPMEFGYDYTDLTEFFDRTQPIKYFFTISTSGSTDNSGHLYNSSIIDYEYDENGIEFPFKLEGVQNIEANKNYTYSVIVPGETKNPPISVVLDGKKLTWQKPEPSSFSKAGYYIYKNDVKIDSIGFNQNSYMVDDENAVYSLATIYKYKDKIIVSDKSNTASKAFVLKDDYNNVYSGSSLVIPNLISKKMNEATIEFWYKPSSINKNQCMLGFDPEKFAIYITTSNQVVAGWSKTNTSERANTNSIMKANVWTHIAVVVNKNEISIYQNGMKKKTIAATQNMGIPALGDFFIGTKEMPLNGQIDEIRIWDKALEMTNIYSSKDYQIANPIGQVHLISYLRMDEIEHNGVMKIRDYARANHALINDLEQYEISSDTKFLKGNVLKINQGIDMQDTIYAGCSYKFMAVSPVTTASWSWNAQGATLPISNLQETYFTFNKTGDFPVNLVIENINGTKVDTTRTITVVEAPVPALDFEVTKDSLVMGEAFSFVNKSKSAQTEYTWKLDGSNTPVINSFNASAVYDKCGTYDVTLIAKTGTTQNSITKQIVVLESQPITEFSVYPENILLGETTYLTDHTTCSPLKWNWILNNGKNVFCINGKNTSYVPTRPGVYDITLNTENDFGIDKLTKKRALVVSNADAKTSLNFYNEASSVKLKSPLPANTNTFTFEFWLFPIVQDKCIDICMDNGKFSMVSDANGKMLVTIGNKVYNTSVDYFIPREWHHYAVTFDNNYIRFYRDNVQEYYTTINASYKLNQNIWDGAFYISRPTVFTKSLIGEFRVWKKALTTDQMAKFIDKPIENIAVQEYNGLQVYYDFNQNGGDVIDRTSKKNDGVRSGFGPDGDSWTIMPGVFAIDVA